MGEITIQILKEYFYDRCSEEQQVEIQNWFAENGDTKRADELLMKLFDSVANDPHGVSKGAFDEFCRRIGYNVAPHAIRAKTTIWRRVAMVAAVAAVTLMIATPIIYKSMKSAPEWDEIYVAYGESKVILLPDNTTLWLNSGSRVTYPDRFDGKTRRVFIEGEAYINVSENEKQPFVVTANNIDIRVLGTTFNLKAYDLDEAVEVMLVEGSVQLEAESKFGNQKILMNKGDIVQYFPKTGDLEKHRFDTSNYKPYVDGGGFRFHNLKFKDIVSQLERVFDVQIILLDDALGQEKFFAYFTNNEELEQILQSLNADSKMSLTTNGDIIFIDKK